MKYSGWFVIILITIAMAFSLTACGSSTLKDAQSAFDAGEYEQAVQIINDSEESIAENEELKSLYISSYEKWAEKLVESGEYEKAIQIINDSNIEFGDGDSITTIYSTAWQKLTNQKLEEKNYYQAYDLLSKMVNGGLSSDEEAKETYYLIGEGFAGDKQFAAAGLAYAKADGYKDSAKKCDASWDKGAYRDTVSICDYTAIGIKADGTVATARNDELIEDGKDTQFGAKRTRIKIDLGKWKKIVSVITTDDHCAGLTEDGSVLIKETGYQSGDFDTPMDPSDWEGIVSMEMDYGTLVGLDKTGHIHITGNEEDALAAATEWENIVAIDYDYTEVLTGIDVMGKVHIVNTYEGDEYANEEDPDNYPFLESDFSEKDVKQLSAANSYAVYITSDGNLETTVTPEKAEYIEFWNEITTTQMDYEDFQGFTPGKGKGFVQCEAGYQNYVGLLSDGTVKVGGNMAEILSKFGASDWKGIKEVHLGITDMNPVVVGITSDGSLKLDGFEGGLYIPFHNKIRAWGKLRKPTIEYDTSGF